jgi:hypothetical protein
MSIFTKVILGMIFYFILTPVAFVLRVAGVKTMDLHPDSRRSSYWEVRKARGRTRSLTAEEELELASRRRFERRPREVV